MRATGEGEEDEDDDEGVKLEIAKQRSTPLSFQLIYPRLIRPSHSTPLSTPAFQPANQHSSPLSADQCGVENISLRQNSGRSEKIRRRLFTQYNMVNKTVELAKKARIEDYLDPLLLSVAAQKVKSARNNQNKPTTGSFDWPSADLQDMTTSTSHYSLCNSTQQMIHDQGRNCLQSGCCCGPYLSLNKEELL